MPWSQLPNAQHTQSVQPTHSSHLQFIDAQVALSCHRINLHASQTGTLSLACWNAYHLERFGDPYSKNPALNSFKDCEREMESMYQLPPSIESCSTNPDYPEYSSSQVAVNARYNNLLGPRRWFPFFPILVAWVFYNPGSSRGAMPFDTSHLPQMSNLPDSQIPPVSSLAHTWNPQVISS